MSREGVPLVFKTVTRTIDSMVAVAFSFSFVNLVPIWKENNIIPRSKYVKTLCVYLDAELNMMRQGEYKYCKHIARPDWDFFEYGNMGRLSNYRFSHGPIMTLDRYLSTTGCRQRCLSTNWTPECCKNHYGRSCQACPGGLEKPCSNHGICKDGITGSGECVCPEGFTGTACELCELKRYGPSCLACNCTENGECSDGISGDGSCFCSEGWSGQFCEVKQEVLPLCIPDCHMNATCRADNLCECHPFYEGDGWMCTVVDRCADYNGGCSEHAVCTQLGVHVQCSCLVDYQGDGVVCTPIDKCADGMNGGCSEYATCFNTGPNSRRCECRQGYVGNGIQCFQKATPPVDRCLAENGGCHSKAICDDLHYQEKTAGVFHFQSPKGKYGFTYEEAAEGCATEGAFLATLQQLSAAQQGLLFERLTIPSPFQDLVEFSWIPGYPHESLVAQEAVTLCLAEGLGLHICLIGWLDNGTTAYPTTFRNPSCGSGHVGIVDFGHRSNLTEKWDAFCYRMKDVLCTCHDGYVGDGSFCNGNLLQVLGSTPNFYNFYAMLLVYALSFDKGVDLLNFLSNTTSYKTLFVPLNSGLDENTNYTWMDLEYHVSESGVLFLSYNLTEGSLIPSRTGHKLSISRCAGVNCSNTPGTMLVNNREIVNMDTFALNGIIHTIGGLLTAPLEPVVNPVAPESHVTKAVIAAVVIGCLLLALAGATWYYLKHRDQEIQFHYFKAEMEEGARSKREDDNPPIVSIPNPVYGAHNSFLEPFGDSFEDDNFSDTHRILGDD